MPMLIMMGSLLGAVAGAAMLFAGASILLAIAVHSLVGTLFVLAVAGLSFVLSQRPEHSPGGLTDVLSPRK